MDFTAANKGADMNNLSKLAIIGLALCLMTTLLSCGEIGGTIIVTNNNSADVSVTVYSDFTKPSSLGYFQYKNKYGPKTIAAGSTDTFNVSTNAEYGIVWRVGKYDEYTTRQVANGEVVEITIR
jgi:hypothetical protein